MREQIITYLLTALLLFSVLPSIAQSYNFSTEGPDDEGWYSCLTEELRSPSGKFRGIYLRAKQGKQLILKLSFESLLKSGLNQDAYYDITLSLSGGELVHCRGIFNFIITIIETESIMTKLRKYDINGFKIGGKYYSVPEFRSADTIDAMCKELTKFVENEGQFGKSPDEEPSANIEKFWIDHNVWRNGMTGMQINSVWTVKNMLGKNCIYGVDFCFENGEYLMDYNNQFRGPNGNVSVSNTMLVRYTDSTATTTLFIPYSELHFPVCFPKKKEKLMAIFYVKTVWNDILTTYTELFTFTH